MIHTKALRFRYPAGIELAFADVQVPQGGTLLLQGRSGSGKSTWLALVAGLLTPSGGSIEVAGQLLGGLSHGARDAWRARNVGFLPQKLHLSAALTVRENLSLAFFAAGVPDDAARVADALHRLGVEDFAARLPSQLSGGQAQRVAIARSILMQPKVLLADEPTASLDDEAATASLSLLREAAREVGATLVIATHDARVRGAFSGAEVYRLDAPVEHPA